MELLRIILLCVVAACVYGILHDQVTARICVEYFTVGHPPVFSTTDPTLLGIGWGVIATWWVGVLLGLPLALVARMGSRPKRTARSLVRPIGLLLAGMAVSAAASGLLGGLLARRGRVFLRADMAALLPPDRHVPFLVDLWAHSASYFVGFAGGLVLVLAVARSRRRSVL